MKSELRPYQKEAVDAFLAAGKGILAIHSGAGKTVIAAAIAEALARKKFGALGAEIPAGSGRSPFVTLVVVPTLDLIDQTKKVMDREGIPNVMVITYAKASRLENDERFWESFDLLVFDEVHHLAQAGAWQRLLVPAFQAPYALGLSATPPTDPENILLRTLPILYTRTLGEGTDEGFAAPVEVRPVPIKLTDSERKEYARLTEKIRIAIATSGSMSRAYTRLVDHDPETGEKIFGGQYMTRRKQLVAMAEQKFVILRDLVEQILGLCDCIPSNEPKPSRVLVWSEYLDVLEKAKRELNGNGPVAELVTGKTPKKERKRLFERWGTDFPVLLAARIAEEGLDYPDLEVGIIIAGAKTTRQNMQRVGRLLRPSAPGKVAKLWVLYAEGTMEEKLLHVIDAVTDE